MVNQERQQPLILVVDDNQEIRTMVTMHLEQMQCEVIQAEDGEEGLALILDKRPDLVLLDVMMPNLSGWEVAKYLRERPEFDGIGIIMVTAIGETVNEMTSPLYGADDHINKPFQFAELTFKVRKLLSAKRMERKAAQEQENTVQQTT